MLNISSVKKGTVIAMIAALSLAVVSVTSAFAASPTPATTTATSSQVLAKNAEVNWKAELADFQFESMVLSRFEKFVDVIEPSTGGVRHMILRDKDGRYIAIKDANALLGRAKAFITAHAGFDANGNVTDQSQADKSVAQLGGLLRDFRGNLFFKLRNLI